MTRLIFLDTTNVEEISKWKDRGICDGVTTNQKIFLAEKSTNFKKTAIAICNMARRPVSIELTGHESVGKMINEAKKYHQWHSQVVIKVPMTLDGMGLEVLYQLKKLKIPTNATIMMSFEQLILAVKSGATYVSIFYNRSKDAGYDPVEIIKRLREFIDAGKYKSQIITGSIRQVRDVGNAFAAGSDIVTITPKVLDSMLIEEMTQKTIGEFDAAWDKFTGK